MNKENNIGITLNREEHHLNIHDSYREIEFIVSEKAKMLVVFSGMMLIIDGLIRARLHYLVQLNLKLMASELLKI